MRIALYVLAGVIGTMITVDAVYIFGLVLGDVKNNFEQKQRRKYGKKEA